MNGNENAPTQSNAPAAASTQPDLFDSSDFDALLNRDHAIANGQTPPPLPPLSEPKATAEVPQPPASPAEQPTPPTPKPAQPAPAQQPSQPSQPSQPAAPAETPAAAAPAAAPTATPTANADDELVDLGTIENGQTVKLPRGKVREALRSYAQLSEGYNGWRQEGEKFRQLFGMPADQAQQVWGELITDVNDDPGLADYLQSAWDNYKSWRGSNPVSNAEKMAAEALKRSQATEQENKQRRVQELQQYVENEKRGLMQQYPMLQDPSLWRIVAQHSMVEAARDNTYTLTRGVQDLLPLLNRMAQNNAAAQPQTEQPAGQVAREQIPALLNGAGASPTGTANPADMEEKQFANLDEATEDWVRNRRALGFS